MRLSDRFQSAGRAALLHLGASAGVAVLAAFLVLSIWYPPPYDELTGGRSLFLILIAVDVVCGPVLTLVLFNPAKPKIKWRIDLALIVLIQLGALGYGLDRVASARPVFLAFEGDRFRVVQAGDIDPDRLHEAQPELARLGYTGPRLIAARLAQPTDPDFPHSVQLSMQGLHPAFRPARWLPYAQQRVQVVAELKSLAVLKQKNPDKAYELDHALARTGLREDQLGYLPLVKDETNDWIVLVRRDDAMPLAYLHLDGW